MEEAIAWVKRCPNPMPGESEIEIRPFFTADDFGEEFTPELRAQEARVQAAAEKLQNSWDQEGDRTLNSGMKTVLQTAKLDIWALKQPINCQFRKGEFSWLMSMDMC